MPWKDSIPPLPPSNLAASGNSISITLNWEKPLPASDGDAAKYFVIYRAASPDTININDPRYIRKILATDTTIYMDVFSVAWNTPYTYIVTSMDKLHNESEPLAKVTFTLTDVTLAESLPKEFKLEQNYPNPFNPTTTINFSIPHSAFVTLKVYDILGREVAALVDEEKLAGTYNFQFSIVNYQLSSGIYFYQLKAQNLSSSSGQVFSEIKKFIILK
ncbi:MAG: T9SS type A sorting domain-containing protein [Bacteroidetes bacterium]|nr:T9SS type A sorting domain-containing protein [Bacteroidota bacterium]